MQSQHLELAGYDERYQQQREQIAAERKSLAGEQAQFQLEQQASLERLARARTEFDALRGEELRA